MKEMTLRRLARAKEELVRVWDYTVTPTRVVKAKNNTATKDVNVEIRLSIRNGVLER